ncbi:reverse transcriptase domain-containing protein [Tanacetum coccineum]
MLPKRTTTTTPMTDAAIKALIAQGVADALAKYEAHKSSGNSDDSYDSGSGKRTASGFNCTVTCQIKFATCTLQGNALTWWNSYVKTVSHEVAYGMTWKTLNKMMIDKYCPRGEIKKLEIELWNLKVKGIDVLSYNQRFQELALMCGRMFPEESDEVENYVGRLPDKIQGSMMASKPR